MAAGRRTAGWLGIVALMLVVGTAAMADNPNWSAEKAAQVANNRCANAGLGNGKELIRGGECLQGDELKNSSENPSDKGNGQPQGKPDIDPGNSGKNANNRKAPK